MFHLFVNNVDLINNLSYFDILQFSGHNNRFSVYISQLVVHNIPYYKYYYLYIEIFFKI